MTLKRFKKCNIPSLTEKKLEQALEKKIKHLVKDPEVKGIAIFGSVARGDYDAHSDIELKVIDKEIKKSKVSLIREEGVDFNIHFSPSVNFKKRKKVKWRIKPPFAESWIVIDETGELKELKQFDQKVSKRGREPLEEGEKSSLQHRLIELIRECKRFRNDPVTFFLLLSEFVVNALKLYYALNQIWWPGPKKVMRDIEDRDPDIASLIKKIVIQENPDDKIDLAEKVLINLKIE